MPFNCTGCPYNHLSMHHLKFENNNSDHLLVFQAPGYDEWHGRTKSGKRIPIDSVASHSCAARMRNSFNRKNKRKKTSRSDYDIAEAVCCYPGQNQRTGRDIRPSKNSIDCCSINMACLLSKHNYKSITCFGDVAYDVVMKAIGTIPGWSGPTPSHFRHPSSRVSNTLLDASY